MGNAFKDLVLILESSLHIFKYVMYYVTNQFLKRKYNFKNLPTFDNYQITVYRCDQKKTATMEEGVYWSTDIMKLGMKNELALWTNSEEVSKKTVDTFEESSACEDNN